MAYNNQNNRPYDKKQYNARPGDGKQRSYGGSRGGDDAPRSYRKSFSGERHADSENERSYQKRPYGNRSSNSDGDRPYQKRSNGSRSASENSYGNRSGSFSKRPYGGSRRPEDKPMPEKRSPVPAEAQEPVPASQQGGEDELPYLLIGRNAVREAIKSGRSIDRILVTKERDGSLGEIVTMARDRNLLLREVDRKKLDELCMPFGHGGKTANHQGVVAYAAGVEYCSVKDILDAAKAKNESPFVIVLDGIEDPYNLGSIIRSAECAGAHGVIIGKRRSASVTAATVKSAAGATEYMNIARVVNITGALEELKHAGLWIAGAEMSGRSMTEQGLNGPLALVIGSEGSGLSKLVRDTCDFLVSIPMNGHIDSLNAGVAAAVLMFEKRRQDAVEQ